MKKWLLSLVLVACATAFTTAQAADSNPTPKAGDRAPLFEARDQDGKNWRLADLIGKKAVLLYFYPKDNTPGCTKQACGLRDQMTELQKENIQVLGVSMDSAESHKKFIADHGLNFPLLVDADGKITGLFGVRMEGRNMSRRASFLIDQAGTIVHVTDVPSADTHLSEMKEATARLARK
jgi:thioredoxin-dependent peroxiredoxin